MVLIICTLLNTAIEVEQSSKIYANLRSILLLLEMEQSQDYKAEKNKNLYLSKEINYDRLLREGIGYLGMIKNFNSWIIPNNTKNMLLQKTLNNLERVKFQYRRMIRVRDLLFNGIVANGIREDIIIVINNVTRQRDELRIDTAYEVLQYDVDEYELIDFYDWQSKTKMRIELLRMINLLIDQIYHAIIKRYLTLYSMLKKYCKRATQFLRSNRKILKSSKLRRKQRNSCCKYHYLKKLIACCRHVLSQKLNEVRINDSFKNLINAF